MSATFTIHGTELAATSPKGVVVCTDRLVGAFEEPEDSEGPRALSNGLDFVQSVGNQINRGLPRITRMRAKGGLLEQSGRLVFRRVVARLPQLVVVHSQIDSLIHYFQLLFERSSKILTRSGCFIETCKHVGIDDCLHHLCSGLRKQVFIDCEALMVSFSDRLAKRFVKMGIRILGTRQECIYLGRDANADLAKTPDCLASRSNPVLVHPIIQFLQLRRGHHERNALILDLSVGFFWSGHGSVIHH